MGLLAELAPFAIAGAIVPTWTTHVILMLGTNRPILNGLAFIAGNMVVRFILGFAVLFFVNGDKVQAWVDSAPETPASVLLVIGLVLVAAGAFIFTRKNKHDVDEMPKWLQAVEAVPPYLAFAWGAVDMAAPGIQYAYFLGGVAVIAAAGLEPAGEIVSLILFILLLQVMMVSPIVLYVAFRGHADRVLGRVKGWLGAHGNQLGGGILILVGLPMLLKGLGVSG